MSLTVRRPAFPHGSSPSRSSGSRRTLASGCSPTRSRSWPSPSSATSSRPPEQVMPRITDPAVVEEADSYIRQEAQHARAHRLHANAMMAQYPGLQETFVATNAAYDELLDARVDGVPPGLHREPGSDVHAAVQDGLRQPPAAIRRRRRADRHVDAVALRRGDRAPQLGAAHPPPRHPDRWYRIRKARQVFDHVAGIYKLILSGFESHVPLEDRHVPTSVVGPAGLWLGTLRDRLPAVRHPGNASMLTHVPGRDLRTMVLHLARSQTPPTRSDGRAAPRRGCGNGTQPGTPGPTWPPTPGPDCQALALRAHIFFFFFFFFF